MVKGFISNEELREEDVEAYIYPDLEYFASEAGGGSGEEGASPETADWDRIQARLNEIVDEVNKELLPYQRIKQITVLREPMEMTTTKKIKRHKVS
jgi:long-chain acyl-CoA synthetase